jgi:hypothetical protein
MLLLQGFDAVDDMKGMFEKQELVQELIKAKYGWESQLGFNMKNGVLTDVTILLNADQVRGETVEKLEKITSEVVANVFKSKPNAIYIQIAIQSKT